MMWRTGIVLAFIAAVAIMAYQIGSRLSDEVITTIVGVLCGITASIPVSIGLLIALTRQRDTYTEEEYVEPEPEPYNVYRPQAQPLPHYPNMPQQPQIIVMSPPQAQMPPGYSPYGNYLMPPGQNPLPAPMQERNFKIVGEDEE